MKSYVFPGNIREDILAIGNCQIPYMRTKEFSDINLESEALLLDFIGSPKGNVIIYTGSGTGAMDAIVSNYVKTKKKAFVIDGGTFGHRWYALCEYYQVESYDYKVSFAKDIDYIDLENVLCREKPDVLLCQHHETSSGQKFDLEKISKLCKKYNISLVVDAISSFLAEELDMETLEIDICLTSTQKGLNIPPGLSIIFISPKLKGYSFAHLGYYFDFEENLSNMKRGQTPYSPATSIFLQLHKRLLQIRKDGGVRNVINKVKERALYFRQLCMENNWNIPAECPSYAITGFYVNRNSDKIFRALIEEKDIFIMPGSVPGFFRISHMGEQSLEDLLELALTIKEIESR